MNMVTPIMRVRVLDVVLRMIFVAVMVDISGMLFGRVGVIVPLFAVIVNLSLVIVIVRVVGFGVIGTGSLDDAALHALAIAAPARVAVARAAAVGTVFGFFFGLAMGAFVGLDQGLAIGDRNLIIIGVDFAEGQEAVAIAAIFDEGGLQRRLDARDLGEIDVAAQLLALGGLEIKFFDAIAADHDDPGLFRVGGVDQHFVGHFGTLDGGGRVLR